MKKKYVIIKMHHGAITDIWKTVTKIENSNLGGDGVLYLSFYEGIGVYVSGDITIHCFDCEDESSMAEYSKYVEYHRVRNLLSYEEFCRIQ